MNGLLEKASTFHPSQSSIFLSCKANALEVVENDLSSIDNEMPAPTTIAHSRHFLTMVQSAPPSKLAKA